MVYIHTHSNDLVSNHKGLIYVTTIARMPVSTICRLVYKGMDREEVGMYSFWLVLGRLATIIDIWDLIGLFSFFANITISSWMN